MSDPASSDVLRDERFIEVADAAPVILWRIDSSFEHDWVNRRWLDYTGGRLIDEKAFAWAARIHPDDRDRVLEELDRAFNAREATAVEFRLLGKDRVYRWFLDRAEPFFRDGAFAGFVGSCIDVTERREAERLTAALQAELAELSWQAAMGGLSVALARDLAAPLDTIAAGVERMTALLGAGTDLPAAIAPAMAEIRTAVRRASDLARQGQETFASRAEDRVLDDLSGLLENLDAALATDPATRGIMLERDLTAGLRVLASPTQVRYVVACLVRDVLGEALGSPSRTVVVSSVKWGDVAVVSVAEGGARPSTVSSSELAEQPRSGENSVPRAARLIVAAHGGRLWRDERASGGPVLRFSLPLRDADAS